MASTVVIDRTDGAVCSGTAGVPPFGTSAASMLAETAEFNRYTSDGAIAGARSEVSRALRRASSHHTETPPQQ